MSLYNIRKHKHIPFTIQPNISIRSEITSNTYSNVGDALKFRIYIINIGNISIIEPIKVKIKFNDNIIKDKIHNVRLAPGYSICMNSSYFVTDNDIYVSSLVIHIIVTATYINTPYIKTNTILAHKI